MSTCQNISHNGLSSLVSGAVGLQQLTLAHGSPVSLPICAPLLLL